jgi:uncharacterized protein YkwD
MVRILILLLILGASASADTPSDMLAENNRLRAQVGLKPHVLDSRLCAAAQDHANYMARTMNMSHNTNGGPFGRARRFMVAPFRENIGMGQPTVAAIFRSWRTSGGHWASICCSTDKVGFGVARGRDGRLYWCAVYGRGPTNQLRGSVN